jgi:azobenzene reductase
MTPRSRTRTLVDAAVEAVRARGAEVLLWDLVERPLPLADPAYYDAAERHPLAEVRELASLAADADAFVLASPVHHNSYSGALKTSLDHLSIRYFARKPVGLLSHGGAFRSVQPCDHLRVVVRGLHGVATIAQVVTADSDFGRSDDRYVLDEPGVLQRVSVFADELVTFAKLFRHVRPRARAAKGAVPPRDPASA